MERLTYSGDFCEISMCLENKGGPYCKDAPCSQYNTWAKLKAYEDAEEKGSMMVLPCKIGDEVWTFRNYRGAKRAQKGIVTEMFFISHEGLYEMKLVITVGHIGRGCWGERVFGSQEEAVAALKGGDPE